MVLKISPQVCFLSSLMGPKTLKYVESADPYMAVCCVFVLVCFYVILVVLVYFLSYDACSVCLRTSGVMRLFEFDW